MEKRISISKRYFEESEFNIESESIKNKIMKYFKKNPKPSDKNIHDFAQALNVNEYKFEELIYEILGEIFGAGKAYEDNFTETDADPEQLRMGIKVEMEHTSNKEISKRIALDHLAEISDYYTRLKKMEEDAGVK